MKKILLLIPLYAAVLTGLGQGQVTNQRLFDTIPFLPDHYSKRISLFEKEPVVTGKIIFLGNSITEGGAWAQLTGDNTVINRGISGDITFGVLRRLDDIIRRKPSRLFILIGINDIGKDISDAVIADNCKKIIYRIRSQSPQTVIFLQSILPLNPAYPGFPQHYDKEHHVISTNILLREVAVETQCKFVNLYPVFLDDQHRLHESFTGDGLHLNRAGYERWINFLKETGCL
jgi:lysophospholipase L1-like esterase